MSTFYEHGIKLANEIYNQPVLPWPDDKHPGVPEAPHLTRFHWISGIGWNVSPIPWLWNAQHGLWQPDPNDSADLRDPLYLRLVSYHGPAETPRDVNRRVSRLRANFMNAYRLLSPTLTEQQRKQLKSQINAALGGNSND